MKFRFQREKNNTNLKKDLEVQSSRLFQMKQHQLLQGSSETNRTLPMAADAEEHNNNDKEGETLTTTRTNSMPTGSSTTIITESLAAVETSVANILRICVLLFLFLTAALVSTSVYLYTSNEEHTNFILNFEDSSHQVIKSFHTMVERNIGAVASLSDSITSHVLHTQATNNNNDENENDDANTNFPFVTLPHFERHGSHVRVLSGSHVVHWMPLVHDTQRKEWEEYTLLNRQQINTAYDKDLQYRTEQDLLLGGNDNGIYDVDNNENQRRHERYLMEDEEDEDCNTLRELQSSQLTTNITVLDDGTGYHPKIWRYKGRGVELDEPDGVGPYLPLWQRSPINGAKQSLLNNNFARTRALRSDLLDILQTERTAILNPPAVPLPSNRVQLEANLKLSQYRDNVLEYVSGLSTFLIYPVFTSFNEGTRQIAGVLMTNVYWKILFTDLLPPSSAPGIICVVENSFNATFSYRIDGNDATFLGMGDFHDPKYDDLEVSEDISDYLEHRAGPQNRAYGTVPLSSSSQYKIRVFPSSDTEHQFVTKTPLRYTLAVIGAFAFVSIIFILFSYVVERRQRIMMTKVIEHAHHATQVERDMNEFLAHEVRNPLSAAISACSFIETSIHQDSSLEDAETRRFVQEDLEVVSCSLHWINDFLRSMLDIQRAYGNKIKVKLSPTDLLRDVLEPVSTIVHKRAASYDVIVDCPSQLMVLTDPIRLKQVIINLVRNSSKFVERGFLRIRADIVDGQVRLYVEDSGPGISDEKFKEIFAKYQASLDTLCQGTGIGLNLSKKLMTNMNGDLWLDTSYNSGIEGCPGACFVVQLNTCPLDIEEAMATLMTAEDSTVTEPNEDGSTQKVETLVANSLLATNLAKEGTTNECLQCQQESSLVVHQLPEGLSILIVDDETILRKLFVRAIRNLAPSWTVQEASSGEIALELCESKKFDMIFLDQYMASVDKRLLGTEATQALRAHGVESKICGLSANNLQDMFIGAGADDFHEKPLPCKADELRAVLLRILNKPARNVMP